MKLLLDTHYLIWLIHAPERISGMESALLNQPSTERLVSAVTIWEIRIKWSRFSGEGERRGRVSPVEAVAFCDDTGISLAALAAEHCALSPEPAVASRDPFDEMLIAHAQQLDARLLTRDRLLIDHPIAYRF